MAWLEPTNEDREMTVTKERLIAQGVKALYGTEAGNSRATATVRGGFGSGGVPAPAV
jgi:hypothetical protein